MNTLTNEQTAKVFGMYAPCEVMHTDFRGAKETAKLIAVDFSTGDLVCTEPSGGMYDYHVQNCKIIASPLSSISDEHAVEVAKILNVDYSNNTESEAYFDLAGLVCYLEQLFNLGDDMGGWRPYNTICGVIDFLRSKSYALPYMGYDLYEAGIAVKPSEI